MTASTLPEKYFRWLYDRVVEVYDIESSRSYITVCSIMHEMPFKAIVEFDENRAADGKELRSLFLSSTRGTRVSFEDSELYDPTVFEVLVGLASRGNYMVDIKDHVWFSIFLGNLRLARYSDFYCLTHPTWVIVRNIRKFNDRRYKSDGQGGLFPLKHALIDQRRVELWYQMAAYATEQGLY